MNLEFTDCTMVLTEQGVERLADLLERPVHPALWAVKWKFGSADNGISFHLNHKRMLRFIDLQIDSVPAGPARLVDVSEYIMKNTLVMGDFWTTLNDFEEAINFQEQKWSH